MFMVSSHLGKKQGWISIWVYVVVFDCVSIRQAWQEEGHSAHTRRSEANQVECGGGHYKTVL